MVPMRDPWNMIDTERHNDLVAAVESFLTLNYVQKDPKYRLFNAQTKFAYWSEDIRGIYELMDLENMEFEEDLFVDKILDELDFILPDILLFHENRYCTDEYVMRVSGSPDLIVEVWSYCNKYEFKEFKRKLYSSSNITEFWQIDQDENTVICSIGKERLPDQDLSVPLRTQKGLVVDLTKLAFPEGWGS